MPTAIRDLVEFLFALRQKRSLVPTAIRDLVEFKSSAHCH